MLLGEWTAKYQRCFKKGKQSLSTHTTTAMAFTAWSAIGCCMHGVRLLSLYCYNNCHFFLIHAGMSLLQKQAKLLAKQLKKDLK